MATVNKNFRIKDGLIVEGTTGTINGEAILTKAQADVDYIIEQVGGSGVSTNTPDTLVLRDGSGNFAAGQITANEIVVQTAGTIFEDSALNITSTSGNDINISANQDVNITSGNGDIVLNADGTAYITSAASGNEIATRGYVDGLASNYDPSGAASGALEDANSYTDNQLESYTPTGDLDVTVGGYGYLKSADLSSYATETYVNNAVDNLVDGAPGLLDTLNEIAAAIADDANYATTMTTALAGKQNELTAGTNISIVSDTISVTGLASTDISDFNTAALSATSSAYDAYGAASTAETNAKTYADDNFVTLDSLPGQLDDYVPVSEKGQALGVATLDEDGYVPLTQLGNVPTAYITGLDTSENNLSVTDGYLSLTYTPSFSEVNIDSVAKQVAATATISGGATSDFAIAYSWAVNSYKSGKFLVKVKEVSSGDVEISELLVLVDASDNVYVTEYGNVANNLSLASVSAFRMGGAVMLEVAPTNNVTVSVFGTLLP